MPAPSNIIMITFSMIFVTSCMAISTTVYMPATNGEEATLIIESLEEVEVVEEACDQFELPARRPLPPVANIPDEYIDNKDIVIVMLTENIRILRQHIQNERLRIDEAYRTYRDSCRR